MLGAERMDLSKGRIEIGGPASAIYAGPPGEFATNPPTGDDYEYNGKPGSLYLAWGGTPHEAIEALRSEDTLVRLSAPASTRR